MQLISMKQFVLNLRESNINRQITQLKKQPPSVKNTMKMAKLLNKLNKINGIP